MSKTLISFLLSELESVRIICKRCKSVIELPINNFGVRIVDGVCPLCNREMLPPEDKKALLKLDNAIAAIKKSAEMDLEFFVETGKAEAPKGE